MTPGSALPAPLRQLLQRLAEGRKLWLVGGAVRDALLDRKTEDLDFVVAGEARTLARAVAAALNGQYFDLDVERDTGRVLRPAGAAELATLDFARLRGPRIEHDLVARDFTINALASPLEAPGELIDPGGGLQDLKDRRLRACSPRAMRDDPVRCLRGARMALEMELRMDPATKEQIRRAGAALPAVAAERVRDEFMLMLRPSLAGRSARLLGQLGLLWQICPDLVSLQDEPVGATDAWQHTLATLDRLGALLEVLLGELPGQLSENLIVAEASLLLGRYRLQLQPALQQDLPGGRRVEQMLCLAALYHAAGGEPGMAEPPAGTEAAQDAETRYAAGRAERRSRQLRLSAAEGRLTAAIIRAHRSLHHYAEIEPLTPLAIHRFFRASRKAAVPATLLHLAGFLAKAAPPRVEPWRKQLRLVRVLLQARFERFEELIDPQPLVRGNELVELLGFDPGPAVGETLRLLAEAQVEGAVRDRDQALEFARKAAISKPRTALAIEPSEDRA